MSRKIDPILGFLLLYHLAVTRAAAAAATSASLHEGITWDVTRSLDEILLKSDRSDEAVRCGSVLGRVIQNGSSTLYYATGIVVREQSSSVNLTKVSQLIQNAHSKCGPKATLPPRLLVSFVFDEKILSPQAPSRDRRQSVKKATLSIIVPNSTLVSGVILLWKNSSCSASSDYDEPLDIGSVSIRIGPDAASKLVSVGFGYRDSNIGCRYVNTNVAASDMSLISSTFTAETNFPESYTIFRGRMDGIAKSSATFQSHQRQPAYFLLRMEGRPDANSKVNLQYSHLLLEFASRWTAASSSISDEDKVILDAGLFGPFSSTPAGDSSSSSSSFASTVIPHLSFDLPGETPGCRVLSKLVTISSLFRSVYMSGFDWQMAAECSSSRSSSGLQKAILGGVEPPPQLQVSLYLDWNRYFRKSALSYVKDWVNQYGSIGRMKLGLVVIRNNVHRIELLDSLYLATLSERIALGNELHFGPLSTFEHQSAYFRTITANILLLQSISVFVWEFVVEFGAAEKENYSYEHYVTQVQGPLERVLAARATLLQELPGKEIVVKVKGFKSEKVRQFGGGGSVFCDPNVLRMNAYYEAMLRWGQIHGVRLILKDAFDKELAPGWWNEVQEEGIILPEEYYLTEMRNYPDSLEGGGIPNLACISWVEEGPGAELSLNKEWMGGTVHSRVGKNGTTTTTLSGKELGRRMEYARHGFDSVEVILDGGGMPVVAAEDLQNLLGQGENHLYLQISPDSSAEALLLKGFEAENLVVEPKMSSSSSSSLKTYPKNLRGVHISDKEGSFWNDHPILKQCLQDRNILLGIESHNCFSYLLNNSTHHNHHLQNGSYLVCVERVEGLSRRKIDRLLARVRTIKSGLAKVGLGPPGLELHFRVNLPLTTATTADTSSRAVKGSRDFLRFHQILNDYGLAYQTRFFVAAFEDPDLKVAGWWRKVERRGQDGVGMMEDHDAEPPVYIEKQSEYFNKSSWKPPPVSSSSSPIKSSDSVAASTWQVVAIMFASSLPITLVLALYQTIRLRKKDKLLSDEEVKEFLQGKQREKSSDIYVNDVREGELFMAQLKFKKEFEIAKKDIILEPTRILGTGNFGTVFCATYQGAEVAVKMPLAHCSADSFRTLLAEVKVLCHLGVHRNLVSFFGAHTKEISRGRIMIVSEMCRNGSLLAYLRRKARVAESALRADPLWETDVLYELARFGYDVASGMAYVSERCVVHGDLSARNVLLDEFHTCKVGDFGLSRKLYQYSMYVKSKDEPLPWAWMAVESLKQLEFTTKSDVWSYGVTLWEIFTLGDIPYAGISYDDDFVEKLRTGVRLREPPFSTKEIYKKMLECWKLEPGLRPTFEDMCKLFLSIRNELYTIS